MRIKEDYCRAAKKGVDVMVIIMKNVAVKKSLLCLPYCYCHIRQQYRVDRDESIGIRSKESKVFRIVLEYQLESQYIDHSSYGVVEQVCGIL